MISPIWEPSGQLTDTVRTRFRLRYSFPDEDGLRTLCAQLQSQHPSVLFALRRLKKISLNFQGVEASDHTICFDKSIRTSTDIMTIVSRKQDKVTEQVYRTFTRTVPNMPRHPDRTQSQTSIKIGFPVATKGVRSPNPSPKGEYVFAFLPVAQIQHLPFLIHANFVLPGSRQSITDNAWNRKLRVAIAELFAIAAKGIVLENTQLSYDWLAYIPLQPLVNFWEPLSGLIKQYLSEEEIFYSRSGILREPSKVRILINEFKHGDEPLFPEASGSWQFLSARYKSTDRAALKFLGMRDLKFGEALDLLDDDTCSKSSRVRTTPLHSAWHDSFTNFIQEALNTGNSTYKDRMFDMPIVPVRVKNKLEWRQPDAAIYFPGIVDEGTGSERIQIEMPWTVDLVVLHPDAATHLSRRHVYSMLGARDCSPAVICKAIEKAQTTSGTKSTSDLLSSLELLFWFSHKLSFGARDNLVALTSANVYANTNLLFMRSDHPFHAEKLLRLAENPEQGNCFLDKVYQESPISTRSRGGLTWEQWLCDVAGVRWYPPLQDPESRDKLHWMIETISSRNSPVFVSLLQNYWLQDYGRTCYFNQKIKKALMKCKVPCQHGGTEVLQKTWFPARSIIEITQKYGIAEKLPILTLPNSKDESLMSEWPSLTSLGVRSALGLPFYQEVLSLLSAAGEAPSIGTLKMGWLYKDLADCVTLGDRPSLVVCVQYHLVATADNLQTKFRESSLIWDPKDGKWRVLDECVWKSQVALNCRFVLTSEYEESTVSGLFSTHLQAADVDIACLIDELEYLKSPLCSKGTEELLRCASAIYVYLLNTIHTPEDKQSLR